MVIYIDIVERILNEPVHFPRTKLQPLLPHQTLMQPNEFKKACQRFTTYYSTKWGSSTHSSNDNQRDRVKFILYYII